MSIAYVLAWMVKPPGLYVGLMLAALIGLWGVHHHGYASGRGECETAHKVAAAREIARQNAAGAAEVAKAETRALADRAKDISNQESIRYVVKTVAARTDANDECMSAAVADRLRGLD